MTCLNTTLLTSATACVPTLSPPHLLECARPVKHLLDPPENGGDCCPRLHCEDGTEPGHVLGNPLVRLRCLCSWVRLDDRFNFSLCYEI